MNVMNHRTGQRPGDGAVVPAAAVPGAETDTAGPLYEAAPSSGPLGLALQEATRCVQCGFCLPVCPTYNVFGVEKHSPRGRIRLVKEWARGQVEMSARLQESLDLCLDCRACEQACPISVRYSVILSGARDQLREQAVAAGRRLPQRLRTAAFRLAVRHVAAKPGRLRFFSNVGSRALRSRVGKWVRDQVVGESDGWLATALVFGDALPRPALKSDSSWPARRKAERAKSGPFAEEETTRGPAGKVQLFLGCAQEGMFPEANRATAHVLERCGYQVDVPAGQVCCGALARHYGDPDFARQLVRRNLEAFGAFDEDDDTPIAMNAGGCMAWMKEAAELFAPGTPEHAAALRMAARVKDISQLLVEATGDANVAAHAPASTRADDSPDTGSSFGSAGANLRVMYQPSCHLANSCGVLEEPLAVLRRLVGDNVTLTPVNGSCCGSAGIYNALHPQASKAILDKKMQAIVQDPPDVIVTSNPGCHLQMLAGVRAAGLEGKVRVMQLAEFVREFGA